MRRRDVVRQQVDQRAAARWRRTRPSTVPIEFQIVKHFQPDRDRVRNADAEIATRLFTIKRFRSARPRAPNASNLTTRGADLQLRRESYRQSYSPARLSARATQNPRRHIAIRRLPVIYSVFRENKTGTLLWRRTVGFCTGGASADLGRPELSKALRGTTFR